MMEYKEALAYLDGARWNGAEPSLRRIRELLSALGDPQKGLKFVHIAGTNGKGSCAAMLASVLRVSGYRTGLYTSPYLYRFSERMQINGEQIPDEALASCVEAVRDKAEKMAEHPTEFELMTAAALLWFLRENCEIVVLETGLGGRFDATNAIEAPECSIIMNIGLDHTRILGDTVEKIAAEKAGIIKAGVPCVVYGQDESVLAVFRARCAELSSPLTVTDFSAIVSEFDSLEGQVFSYKGREYALSLLGAHQRRNAAVVIEAAKTLRDKGWRIDQDALEHGLYAAAWPGRFELCCDEPAFIVDGGHNPQCAETVATRTRPRWPRSSTVRRTNTSAPLRRANARSPQRNLRKCCGPSENKSPSAAASPTPCSLQKSARGRTAWSARPARSIWPEAYDTNSVFTERGENNAQSG